MIGRVDQAIAGSPPSTKSTRLFRVVTSNPQLRSELVSAAKGGESWTDPGFMSTSTSRDSAEEFDVSDSVRLDIFAPAGTQMADMKGVDGYNQHEQLLPRGTTLQLSEPTQEGGLTVIRARVVPTGAAPATGPTKAPAGDRIYKHPLGATITVHSDGSMDARGTDGKPKKTSATPEKLAAGHGRWKEVSNGGAKESHLADTGGPGSKPAKQGGQVKAPALAEVPATEAGAAKTLVVSPKAEPEIKSDPPPAATKFRVPMRFESAPLEDVPKYIADPNYFFQQKVDGIRGQLVIEPGKKPWFRSSNGGTLVSDTAAKVVNPMLKKLGELPSDGPSYTIDGEMLDGKWYVFDMTVDGHEKVPWEERMAIAQEWVNQVQFSGIGQVEALPTARTAKEKQALWDAVNASGGEGVMMKRRDAKYQYGGKTGEILKGKITATADAVVMERNRGGKANAVLGVYKNGKLTEIGSVPTDGKEKDGPIKVGDVLEVEYLWAHPTTGKISQGRIKKKRPDKDPLTATADQLRFVNKQVLGPQ